MGDPQPVAAPDGPSGRPPPSNGAELGHAAYKVLVFLTLPAMLALASPHGPPEGWVAMYSQLSAVVAGCVGVIVGAYHGRHYGAREPSSHRSPAGAAP